MAKLKIKFHRDLYPEAAIKKAASDFSKIANFKMQREGNYHLVIIETKEPKQSLLLKGNFLNYVLMLAGER